MNKAARNEAGYPSRAIAYYTVGVLMLASIISFVNRYMISLLVGPIRHEFGVSDSQMGVLQGLAFAISYAIMAWPFGWVVDRTNRKNAVIFGVVVWGGLTLYSGFVTSFTGLVIARLGVGFGEAVLMPAAFSLIADCFRPEQRGRALSVFIMSAFAGGSGAFILGGYVLRMFHGADAVVMPIVGTIATWRASMIVVALPNVLVGCLLATVPEPSRKGVRTAASTARAGTESLWDYVKVNRHAFLTIYGSFCIMAFVAYAITPWVPTYFVRKFTMSAAQAGLLTGITSMAGGMGGSLVGGILGDRWSARGVVGGRFRLMMVWWVLGLPAVLMFLISRVPALSAATTVVFYVANAFGYVTIGAVIQDIVPNRLRGRATALFYLISGVLGNGFGPYVTALVGDQLASNGQGLLLALTLVPAPMMLAGLVVTWIGLRPYDTLRARAARLASQSSCG